MYIKSHTYIYIYYENKAFIFHMSSLLDFSVSGDLITLKRPHYFLRSGIKGVLEGVRGQGRLDEALAGQTRLKHN